MIDERLVDEIYEAAVVPELWPTVLQRVAAASGSHAGGLIAIDGQQRMQALSTETYRPTYESFARGESLRYENLRAQRAAARRYQGFLRDVDLCTLQELEADRLYRDFLHPYGLGWTSGSLVNLPTADLVIFDFARRSDDGPHDLDHIAILDGYRPHLARASFLSARLGLERARSMTQAMSALGLPAAALGPYGNTVASNPAFDRLRPRVEPVLLGRRTADPLFDPATVASSVSASSSIPIGGDEETPPLVVHVLPVRRAAIDVFAGASAIAVVTPLSAPAAPPIEIVAALFDLSPAEARVAHAVAEGRTLEDCAHAFGISLETIRKQLKAAMNKTGTHRQIELARLLLGAGRLPGER